MQYQKLLQHIINEDSEEIVGKVFKHIGMQYQKLLQHTINEDSEEILGEVFKHIYVGM